MPDPIDHGLLVGILVVRAEWQHLNQLPVVEVAEAASDDRQWIAAAAI